jgi:predicted transcriptional regulator
MTASRELSDPIALRIPVDILRDIEAIAETTERTRSWVIVRALKAYLASEGGDVLAIREGERQIAAGDAYPIEDVIAEIEGSASKSAA